MFTAYIWMAAIVAALTPAAEHGQNFVEVMWTGRHESAPAETARVCFGGTSINVPLRVFGLVGKRIDLTAQLFQVSQELAAPVGGPLEVVEGLLFGVMARTQLEWTIELPAVERPTTFELRFYARDASDTAFKPVGRQALRVHPPDPLRELRKLSAKTPIAVEDPTGQLIPFLRAQGINHIDIDRVGPHGLTPTKRSFESGVCEQTEPARLALRVCSTETDLYESAHERDDTEIALLKQGYRIIRFREKAETVPAIVIERSERGVRIDVEMPLLNELAESPAAQLLLLDIVRRANEETAVQPPE